MSWITIVWSVNGGICLALAGMQLLVWAKSHDAWANLLFSIAAAAAAANAFAELALMRAQTPAQFGILLRDLHVPLGVLVVSLVWFVRFYLQAGRLWLAWLVTGLRVVVLVLTFSLDPNLNFRDITGLNPISIWGETVVVAIGEKNPWTNITHLSGLLFLVFVLDAAFSAWRRGDRQRAGVVGLTFGSAIAVAVVLSELLNRGTLPVPFSLSFPFLIILVGIAYVLSMDLVRARQLASELRESQERMRLATSAANVGVWEWDIGRDEVWVTDTIRAAGSLDASERLDLEGSLRLVHPDDRERVRRTIGDALESARDFEMEYRGISASDATPWIAARGQVVRASNGKPILIRGVTHDITERKLAEQSLQQSAQFNEQVLASLRQEIAILDREGTIIAVNEAWKEFSRANGDGADWVDTNYLDTCRAAASAGDSTAMRALSGLQSVVEGARDFFQMEYSCPAPGQDRYFLMRAVPLRASGGGAVVAHMNVTQLRLAELEAQRLRGDLAHMSRVSTLGHLSSALAHELSQPLGAILRNAEAGELFLQQDPPDYEEIRGILMDIKRDEQRAAAVIDRMRALLRRQEPALEPLSVREMLEQVVALAHAECQARRAEARLEIADNLPPVRGDRVQLQQVMLNLIINALDAMNGTPADRRQLTVTAGRLDEQSVEVAVSDTGHGIATDQVTRVFEPFHTSKSDGLGLGLAISKTIIESHGGRIRAESNQAGGTTFCFTLKVAEPGVIA